MIHTNSQANIVYMSAHPYGDETEAVLSIHSDSPLAPPVAQISGLPVAVAKAAADAFNEAMDAERAAREAVA